MSLQSESAAIGPAGARSSARDEQDLDLLAINTIRTLAIDAVEKAKSGHAGAPMGHGAGGLHPVDPVPALRSGPARCGRTATASCFPPGTPRCCSTPCCTWPACEAVDRGGEPLGRPAVSLDDIKTLPPAGQRLRRPPGARPHHRRRDHHRPARPGRRQQRRHGDRRSAGWRPATTGRATTLFDYNVYALCSDGDLMEGVGQRGGLARRPPAALQPLLDLRRQPASPSRATPSWPSPRTWPSGSRATAGRRSRSTTPTTARPSPRAVESFQATDDRPTLILVRSVIGYGSPHKQGTSQDPQRPAGRGGGQADQATPTAGREDAQFLVPDGVQRALRRDLGARGGKLRQAWDEALEPTTPRTIRDLAGELNAICGAASCRTAGTRTSRSSPPTPRASPRREASGKMLQRHRAAPAVAGRRLGRPRALDQDHAGRSTDAGALRAGQLRRPQLPFRRPRARHGGHAPTAWRCRGLRPYAGTFLVFSDYMRPPIRLAALMELPVIYVFTHDSIGLGQDGPTHQPIEQLAALRAIPDLIVLRPGDANETAEAWRAILRAGPAAGLPGAFAPGAADPRPRQVTRRRPASPGAAMCWPTRRDGAPQVILIGHRQRGRRSASRPMSGWPPKGVRARVVSMPSWELFEAQDAGLSRRGAAAGGDRARVAVEAGRAAGLGPLRRAARARSSPCAALAPRRRSRTC